MNRDKVKIYFENDDIKTLDIKYSEMDYKNEKIKRIFWRAIYFAKEETGFDPTGFKLLIEAYPGRDGGFMLYVTRLYKHENTEADLKAHSAIAKNTYIYCFDCLDDLLDCLCCFKNCKVKLLNSSIYKQNGKYFLVLSINNKSNETNILRLLKNLNEYGQLQGGKYAESVLQEHGEAIINSCAISKIVSAFK